MLVGRFTAKTAVILGVAPGNMGEAIARKFRLEGGNVVVAGRRAEAVEATAREIGGIARAVDAGSEEDLRALVSFARDTFGSLDIAVNSTGRNLVRPLLDTSVQDLEELASIQFVAPFLFLQAMVRGMTEGGSIVHLSSVSVRTLLRDHAAYTGTKCAMEQVVRAFAWEFGHRGIRINSVAPGVTATPMTASALTPAFVAQRAASLPLGRIGTPEDIAEAVAWLSDPGCFMTGETLQVNGGATLLGAPVVAPGSSISASTLQREELV